MATLEDRIAGHERLGLDTAVFIYHLEQHPRYVPLTHPLLTEIESGHKKAHTSMVTLMELTVRPWQLDRPEIARQYETALARFPNLTLVEVTREVARQAAQLRAAYRLRPADALHVATALASGATLLITNDYDLTRLAPAIDVLVLEDLASP
jgi:predicted nucleic acid-binding protein